jgi:hypothetical protein
MRHHLVVNLQPIGMIYEVMERRLRAAEPNLTDIHDSAHKINGFARAALNSCLDVVTWLAPEEDASATVPDGVRECLGLLATSFTFRGYTLRNDVGAIAGDIRRPAIRTVLSAALIHVTDENPAPAVIVLSAERTAAGAVLTLTASPSEGEQGFNTAPAYRPMEWADLQALADAEGVQLAHDGRQRLRLTLPWAAASRG